VVQITCATRQQRSHHSYAALPRVHKVARNAAHARVRAYADYACDAMSKGAVLMTPLRPPPPREPAQAPARSGEAAQPAVPEAEQC